MYRVCPLFPKGENMGRKRKSLKLVDVPKYESLVTAVRKAYSDVRRGRYRLRDLVLASILIFTGCRLGEALRLRGEDIDLKHRTIKIHQEKKGREFHRIVPVPSTLFWEIMERYLLRLPSNDIPLFKVSDRQARNIVYKFTIRYLGKRYRPHSIRHSYAIFILKNTKDLEALRRLLGHTDYKWLKCYLDYTQEDLEEQLTKAYRSIETTI